MSKEVSALGWAVKLENVGDGIPEPVACPLAHLSQQRLELGGGLFDRIKVGAIGRQVEQPGIPAFDLLLDAGHFMAGQIVHDDKPRRSINPLRISSSVRAISVSTASRCPLRR